MYSKNWYGLIPEMKDWYDDAHKFEIRITKTSNKKGVY